MLLFDSVSNRAAVPDCEDVVNPLTPRGASKLLQDLSFWELPRDPSGYKRTRSEPLVSDPKKLDPMNRSKSGDALHDHDHPGAVWKTAKDPVTGRTYYYDAVTRRTQWEKPAQVRARERLKRQERRRRDEAFFMEMEANILAQWERGNPMCTSETTDTTEPSSDDATPEYLVPTDDLVQLPTQDRPPSRVRTISGMDEILLRELQQQQNQQPQPHVHPAEMVHKPSNKHTRTGRPPLPARQKLDTAVDSLELSPDLRPEEGTPLVGEFLLDGPVLTQPPQSSSESTKESTQSQHIRRNTGDVQMIKSTMWNPNIEATIKCVCGVYRAHIVQALEQTQPNNTKKKNNRSIVGGRGRVDEQDIFCDQDYNRTIDEPTVPTLTEIVTFYQEFYSASQMEHDTIIMSLIYVERLIKEKNTYPTPRNWRSLLFACMVLASKVWDDLSMWNVDFSNVCSAKSKQYKRFTLRRINELESSLLKALQFDVRVLASEYAKYYFLIRSMLFKSGCLADDDDQKGSPKERPAALGHDRRCKSIDGGALLRLNESQWQD